MSSTLSLSSTATSVATATASCITVTPDHNGYVPEYACNANYNYYPSFAAAIVFTLLFGFATFFHIYQATSFKKWKLCWPLIMGVSWELASFSTRAAGTKLQQNTALATVSQLLVLLAPMWINAFIYMVLGRMIYFFVPEQKIFGIRGIKLAKIFVWLDVLSFLTQVGGGIMISPGGSYKTLMLGIHIYMGGIGFQEACILAFTAIAVKFLLTMRQQDREMTSGGNGSQILDGRPHNWAKLLYVLFACLALITIRIIFRMIEFAKGLDPAHNAIPYHEAYFLVLDALPMLIAALLLIAIHPGRVLQGEGSEFPKGPSRKEKKEAKRVKKEEKNMEKEKKKAAKAEKKRGYSLESVESV